MASLSSVARRSALEGYAKPGDFGPVVDDIPGITVQERRALAIVNIDVWDDQKAEAARAFGTLFGDAPPANVKAVQAGETCVMWVGPNRYLVSEKETRDLFSAVTEVLTEDLAAVTDQGHSRVCWRVSGPMLRSVLAKGSTLDFDYLAKGDCVGTLLGHVTITLHFVAEDAVDIYAARSFAQDLHHWLTAHGMEYGARILEPA